LVTTSNKEIIFQEGTDVYEAIQIKEYGGEDQLEWSPSQALRVRESGRQNHRDVVQPIDPKRAREPCDRHSLRFPFLPGSDFSGVVSSVGTDVESLHAGDEVYGYSLKEEPMRYIVIDADKVSRKPRTVSHIEAASLALVAQTALQMLDRAGVQKGQKVLIHGAGGAVGSVACRQHTIGGYCNRHSLGHQR